MITSPLAALFLAHAALAGTLDISGECPGQVDIDITWLSPSAPYALVTSSDEGSVSVPGGPCRDTVLGLAPQGLALRAMREASGSGRDSLSPILPAPTCGLPVQVLDLATCETTNVARIPTPPVCGELMATVRDFSDAHPDMESFIGDGPTTGLVLDLLVDDLPVLDPTHGGDMITSAASFQEWYRDVPGVNVALQVPLTLTEAGGLWTFESEAWFPVDGQGLGNEGRQHNFHFTTELRSTFRTQGGETLILTGDDDTWVFVDGRLVLDAGGVHSVTTASVDIDSLGLDPAVPHTLDIFRAERHTALSSLTITTDLCLL